MEQIDNLEELINQGEDVYKRQGVSPVTMDDLTSGFNIGTNYSLTPQFNQMMGFTEEEVR